MHLIHKWGRWELADAVASSLLTGSRPVVIQMRECAKCGKTQVQSLTV